MHDAIRIAHPPILKESEMGVGPTWGRFPICPETSRFVPVCPLLFVLGPRTGTNGDKRGRTGTKRDVSGQMGKRPMMGHLGSTPF